MIGFYRDDFNDDILRVQLRTLPAVIGQGEGSVNTFHDIRILVKQLKKPIRNLISEVATVIKLVIVLPATNAVSERSFCTMRRLYTYLRTNMRSTRLNNAMVLHIHKARLGKLSMVDVANDFVFESDHRKTLFGRFDDVDLRRKNIAVKSVEIQISTIKYSFVMKSIYCHLFCLFVVLNLLQISTSDLPIRFLAILEVKLRKQTHLLWTCFARLFSLCSPYHIQKQCGVPDMFNVFYRLVFCRVFYICGNLGFFTFPPVH